MDKSIWEEAVGKNANKKIVGSCNRCEEEVYAKKEEGVPIVKRRERGSERICERTVAEGLYSAVEVTTNSAGVFC